MTAPRVSEIAAEELARNAGVCNPLLLANVIRALLSERTALEARLAEAEERAMIRKMHMTAGFLLDALQRHPDLAEVTVGMGAEAAISELRKRTPDEIIPCRDGCSVCTPTPPERSE